jgi:hypothetical protein
MRLKEMEWKDVDWILLPQDKQMRVVMDTFNKLPDFMKGGKFLIVKK